MILSPGHFEIAFFTWRLDTMRRKNVLIGLGVGGDYDIGLGKNVGSKYVKKYRGRIESAGMPPNTGTVRSGRIGRCHTEKRDSG